MLRHLFNFFDLATRFRIARTCRYLMYGLIWFQFYYYPQWGASASFQKSQYPAAFNAFRLCYAYAIEQYDWNGGVIDLQHLWHSIDDQVLIYLARLLSPNMGKHGRENEGTPAQEKQSPHIESEGDPQMEGIRYKKIRRLNMSWLKGPLADQGNIPSAGTLVRFIPHFTFHSPWDVLNLLALPNWKMQIQSEYTNQCKYTC